MVKPKGSVSDKSEKINPAKNRSRKNSKNSDLRYRRLVEASPLGIQENGTTGIITYSNAAHAKMLGYEPGEIVGKPIWSFHADPEEREKLKEYLAYLVEQQPPPTPYIGKPKTKDGRLIDVQVDWNYEHDEQGNLIGFTSVITDITERQRAEEELQRARDELELRVEDRTIELNESEVRYRQMAELSPDGMYVHVDGEIVFANASLAKILAYPSPKDLLGKQAIDLLAPKHRAYIMRLRDRVMAGEVADLEQSEFLRFDGSRIPVERTAAQVSWNNNPAVLILLRDVSERVEAERALTESSNHLRLITDNLPAVIVYVDAELRYRFANETSAEWHARPVEEFIGRTVSEVFEHEYEKFRSRIDRALAGEQLTYIDNITYADGVTRTVRATHVPHVGATGNVEGYFSLVEDISELQQVEEELQAAQTRLIDAIESIPDGFALYDADDRLVLNNERYKEVYPKHADLLVEGERFEDMLRAGVYRGEFADAIGREKEWIAERLRNHADPQGPIEQRLSDGRWLRSEERRTSDGGTVGLRTDITDLKRAEQAISDSETLYRQLVEMSPDGMFVHIDGEIVFANGRLAEILDVPSPIDFLGTQAINLPAPEYRVRVGRTSARVMEGKVAELEQSEFLRSDGSRVPVESSTALISWEGNPAILILVRDVSERLQAATALRESEERFELAVQGSNAGLWDRDIDSSEVYFSPRWRAILGYDEDEIKPYTGTFFNLLHPDDLDRTQRAVDAHLKDRIPYDVEFRLRHKDGSYLWVQATGQAVWDDNGKPVRMAGSITDISDRKRVERALSDSEIRYRQLAEVSPDAMFVLVDGEIVFANASSAKILAYPSPDDLLGKQALGLVAPEYRAHMGQVRANIMKGGISGAELSVFLRSDGSRIPVERTGALVSWEGNPAILALVRDVSARVETERALVESRDQLRLVTNNLPAVIVYIDAELRYRFANKTSAEWHARPVEEIVGKTVPEVFGQDYEKIRSRIENTLAGKQLTCIDTITYTDGVTRTVRATYIPHYGAAGSVEGYFSLVEDISELQRAEDALRESEAHLRAIIDNSPSVIFLKDTDGYYIFANQVWHDMHNPTGSDIVGKTAYDFFPPEIADPGTAVDVQVLETGVPVVDEKRMPTSGGGSHNVLQTKFPVHDVDGNIIALGAVNTDITERVAMEQALRESEARFRAIVENAPFPVFLTDTASRLVLVNRPFEQWYGIADGEAFGKSVMELYPEEYAGAYIEHDQEVLTTLNSVQQEHEVPFADGSIHTVLVTKFPIVGAENRPLGIAGIATDLTDFKTIEEQLRQVEKMNAMAQVVGGVAHEFNNLLQAMTANLELIETDLASRGAPTKRLGMVLDIAFRGGELTQRLLSYVGKQVLAPKVVDMKELVLNTVELTRPLVGETIELEAVLADDLWAATVDSGQLEDAVLNLVVNARDAMPKGGTVIVEAANVHLDAEFAAEHGSPVVVGDYVEVMVRDTGIGMSDDVVGRATDPFFTTKAVGQGTGLGLSMVYGFVTQSGGYLKIDSEVEEGTNVALYLARHVDAEERKHG